MSFDLHSLQQRILAGETLSAEEYRAVIESLRSSRTTASQTAAKRSKKAEKLDSFFDLDAEIEAVRKGEVG